MSLLKVLGLPLPPRLLPAAAQPAVNPAKPAKSVGADLAQAAQAWQQVCTQAAERIAALQQAVKTRCADGAPALLQQLDKGLAQLEQALKPLDGRLADALRAADEAANDKARAQALKNARALVAQHIAHVKDEPLVAHMDRNPFEVKTGLKALLADGLTQAAKALG